MASVITNIFNITIKPDTSHSFARTKTINEQKIVLKTVLTGGYIFQIL